MGVNWQEVITAVGTAVGGGSALLAAAAWLTKTVITDRLNHEAEAFKTRLKADSDAEIERLRSSLQMAAVEHQVRFAKLHERRAEAIVELYRRLVDVYWGGQSFVLGRGDQERVQREYDKTMGNIGKLALFAETNKIYLPEHVCRLLDEFVDQMRNTVNPVGVYGGVSSPGPETGREEEIAVVKAFQAFRTSIPAARIALEKEFRQMLGVAETKTDTVPGTRPART